MQSSREWARKYRKVFLNEQCKDIEKNNKMGKTRDLFKKIGAIIGLCRGQQEVSKRWETAVQRS